MLGHKFSHNTVRKAIIAFGSLFTDIYIDRVNENTGEVEQTLKVPLLYSPRQKSIASIEATPESYEQEFQVLLPRMGFEIISFQHDAARKVAPMNTTMNTNRDYPNSTNKMYAPNPYSLNLLLSIYAKNQDDGWQIIEQIVPFFNPNYNVNKHSIPELGMEDDLPIFLENISFEDQYTNTYTERRAIIWSLTFSLKLNFYGPVHRAGVIKRTIVDINNLDTGANIATNINEILPFTASREEPHVINEFWKDY